MTEPVTFMLAVLALLATPGPTNTLLMTAGATGGFSRGGKYIASLMLAEVTGYLVGILGLALLLGPTVRAMPLVDGGLRLVCGLYLAVIAFNLWRRGAQATMATLSIPIRPRQVLLTTLMNPKGSIFAFVILPYVAEGRLASALPYLAGLIAAIMTVALGWIGAGGLVKRFAGAHVGACLVCRCSAAVLAVLAMVVSLSGLQRTALGW